MHYVILHRLFYILIWINLEYGMFPGLKHGLYHCKVWGTYEYLPPTTSLEPLTIIQGIFSTWCQATSSILHLTWIIWGFPNKRWIVPLQIMGWGYYLVGIAHINAYSISSLYQHKCRSSYYFIIFNIDLRLKHYLTES